MPFPEKDDNRSRAPSSGKLGFDVPDPRIEDGDRNHCEFCGREVSAKWNFCPQCGTSLTANAPSESLAKSWINALVPPASCDTAEEIPLQQQESHFP